MSRLFEALVIRDLPSAQLDLRRTLQKKSAADAPWKDQFFGYTAQEFAKVFQAEFGYWPDYHPPQSAAALEVFQAAIEKTGSLDPQKIRDAIAQTNIMTFYGPVRFNELGENTAKSMGVTQIQDGKPVVVYPADQADTRPRLN